MRVVKNGEGHMDRHGGESDQSLDQSTTAD